MRAVRRGFALILVMLAVAAVFALAMQSAVVSRASMLEARLMHERVDGERRARSAAVLVLKGLTTAGGRDRDAALAEAEASAAAAARTSLTSAGGGDGEAEEEKPKTPDLPDILKEILGIKEAEEIDKGAKEAAQLGGRALSDGRGLTGRSSRAVRNGFELLEKYGLPGLPIGVEVEGMKYRVALSDAAGMLNVNLAGEERFARFLEAKGVDAVQAMSIARQLEDWRDGDSLPRERGAERESYAARGLACRDADVFAVEELLYLPSMTQEIYDRIKDDLTVAGDGRLHLGSASREALLSIQGMTPGAVDAIMAARRENALTEKTVASLLADLPAKVKEALRLAPSSIVRLFIEPMGPVVAAGSGAGAGSGPSPGAGPVAGGRFEGLAVMTSEGVQEIGLRPM